jgi:predicted Rossmann fold nucleotide-binding protein DprA/Smf involved in DNA uptake
LTDYAASQTGQKENQVNTVRVNPAQMNLTDQQQRALACLDSEPVHIEELIMRTQLPVGIVHSALVHLQLKQLIRQLPGGFYTKRVVSNG